MISPQLFAVSVSCGATLLILFGSQVSAHAAAWELDYKLCEKDNVTPVDPKRRITAHCTSCGRNHRTNGELPKATSVRL